MPEGNQRQNTPYRPRPESQLAPTQRRPARFTLQPQHHRLDMWTLGSMDDEQSLPHVYLAALQTKHRQGQLQPLWLQLDPAEIPVNNQHHSNIFAARRY